jgi:glycine/D-amino acid oxidase-like deaminating enzyme
LDLRKSTLEPFKSQADLARLGERAFHGRFLRLFGTQIIPRNESLSWLNPSFIGALLHPDDFSFDAQKSLEMLLKVFLEKGGEQIGKKVSSVEKRGGWFVLHTACGFQYSFDEVIVSAGASTPFLLKASGFQTDGFTYKAGVGMEAKSPLVASIKRGQTSLNGNGKKLKFSARDFKVSPDLGLEDFEERYGDEIQAHFNELLADLKDLSPHFLEPLPLAGVRLDGPQRSPYVGRYSAGGTHGPLVAAGFHKSAWSLAWWAADTLLDLVEKS